MIRHFPFAVGGLVSLPVAAAERASGHAINSAAARSDEPWIDYRGPTGTIRTIPFSDVVRGRLDPAAVRGKVVVVGASAPTLQDVHPTATTGRDLMPGPEIQANAIWTALHGFPLRPGPGWLDLLAIILLALASPLLNLRARVPRVPRVAIGSVLLALAYAGACQLAFGAGWIVSMAYPLGALLLGTVGMVIASYLTESRERERVDRYNRELEAKVQKRTQDLRETQLEIIRRLGQAAESRDEQTGEHIERMSRLCHMLGRAAGMSEQESELLRHASAMHDVGKIGIPDRILLKPGKFEPEEFEVMKRHTSIGAAILSGSRSSLVQMAEVIARTHHERWDGSGYPCGLAGEEIPMLGRISAICDVFDALLSARPYKPRWSFDDALAEIERASGSHFDPRLVEVFLTLEPPLRSELEREAIAAEQASSLPSARLPVPGPAPAPQEREPALR